MPRGHAPPPYSGIFEWAAFFPEWAGPSRNRILGYTVQVWKSFGDGQAGVRQDEGNSSSH
eukprot:1194675-Prorocentrum_minimum.AAC.5